MGNECDLPVEDMKEWIDTLFYLNSSNLIKNDIKCDLEIYSGMKLEERVKFKPKDFSELLSRILPSNLKKSQLSTMCTLEGKTTLVEETKIVTRGKDGTINVTMADLEKKLHLDIAFRYGTSVELNDTAEFDTYCNYTNTIENGTHLDAFVDAYCRFMQGKINVSLSEVQKSKLKVTWDDIRTNLFCVINLTTNAAVGFVGNAKTKINCENLLPYMKELITEKLTEYYKANSNVLTEHMNIIKLNAKARLEAQKAKAATTTERINTMGEHLMKNLIRCNNKGKQFKEIMLVEGNSAASTFRNACDPDTQAAFMFRGVVANAFKCSLSEIMQNAEWRDLVTVLRTGIGPKFDVNKLYFDRINIFTDEDIDGFGISAGMLAFFYRFMRPIIEQGKLYKIYTPLYKLDDKDHRFVVNKSEMIDIHQDRVVKNYKIWLENCESSMSKSELKEFLTDTYEYRSNLILAADNSGKIPKFFLEIVIAMLVLHDINADNYEEKLSDQKVIKSIMSKIQKKYKEVTFSNNTFSGIVDGKLRVLKVNRRLFKKTEDILSIYPKYGYYLKVLYKNNSNAVAMSIGEFLEDAYKLMPRILTRYKGLGELNADELRKTALDINHRVSVRYTVDDVERELAIFAITHGVSKEDAVARKAMMKAFKIDRDDLDN